MAQPSPFQKVGMIALLEIFLFLKTISKNFQVRMSSPQRFEIKQLIAAGVADPSEHPDFDEETGLLPQVKLYIPSTINI